MYLKTLNLGDIHPYERNPRINDKAVKPVMKSIQKDGYRARIIVDGDGVIIAGHTRYEAMKRLGWTEAEVWIADDMTPEQIADYRIRDNLTADFAEWDFSELEAEIQELDLDFDMSEFEGFEDIQGGVSDTSTAEEDDFDEDIPIEPKSKLGDIYQLGQHRLICGDSTDVAVIDRLMDGVKADMVFTDPPYGVSANGGRGDTKKKLKMQDIANDDLREDDLCNFLQSSFSIMPVKEGASIYICYPWATQEEFTRAIKNCGYTLQNCIIWRKNVFGLNGFKGYRPQYEMIYFCSKSDYQWYGDLAQSNVWDFNRSTEHIGRHPTVKPIELIAKALKNSSKKEDVILDVFGGSGSTLIACEQLNRKCYMCELDPHYVDVIIARWEKFTGEKAVLLNG